VQQRLFVVQALRKWNNVSSCSSNRRKAVPQIQARSFALAQVDTQVFRLAADRFVVTDQLLAVKKADVLPSAVLAAIVAVAAAILSSENQLKQKFRQV
jgi:hypothetical protein